MERTIEAGDTCRLITTDELVKVLALLPNGRAKVRYFESVPGLSNFAETRLDWLELLWAGAADIPANS